MELGNIRMIRASSLQLFLLLCLRGLSHASKAFRVIAVVSFAFLLLASFGPSFAEIPGSAEDACWSCKDNYDMVLSDIYLGGISLGYKNPMNDQSVENVCTSSDSFCFPSTLPGFPSKEHAFEAVGSEVSGSQSDRILSGGSAQSIRLASNLSWSLDRGLFGLFNGRTLSCSLSFREGSDELSSIPENAANHYDLSSCKGPLVNHKSTGFMGTKESESMKSISHDGSSSPHIEINPPVLDWGQEYLYFPSVAFLTVENTDSDSILHIYEPFSTDIQFYPCNFSEVLLRPGEVASVCFVFLPRYLGSSSAQLILQTSFGGFLVQAKGSAMESPYGIQPLAGPDETSNGRWMKNLSLSNPLDETLYVEEVTAWISVSSGNTSHYSEASCSVENFQYSDKLGLPSDKEWLIVNNGQVGLPVLAIRPHKSWEIGPQGSENIVELDFSAESEGKIFGVFCMRLLRSSQDKSETVMVPLEGQLNGKATYNDLVGPVTVSIEALVPFYLSDTVAVAISLRNSAPYLLNVVKVTEVAESKVLHIKYMEGLLLFPGTVTQVAVVTCSHQPDELIDSQAEIFSVNKNCKLLLQTNDSSTPQVEIPCQDIINICSIHQKNSSVGYEHQSEKTESVNARTRSLTSGLQLPSQAKVLEVAEADELVLANWKSQGTSRDMSVIEDSELLFPMIQVGTHCSKWITVKNPSQKPVVMQLILNSGEIIDECRGPDGFVQPPSSGSLDQKESTKPTKYGFSIAENALTEAYVQPHGRASFGPIFFHPSQRCAWRSSVLIRNNLSGVEWLSLRGNGGSLSLALLEGSEPVRSIEFNLNLPIPFNTSPPDMLAHMKDSTHGCSQFVSRELYAKNTGDLPLEVRKIEVSGTKCGLDGFIVHTCKGFALEPGESIKFLISYQTDFSAALVHRDLELSLATGMLVIPMKASLPAYMLNLCKKSLFWVRVKKVFLVVFLAVCIMFLVFCCIFPQVMALGSQNSLCKSDKSSIPMVRSEAKPSRVRCNEKTKNSFVSSKMDDLLKSVEDRASVHGSLGRCPDSQSRVSEPLITGQHVKLSLVSQSQSSNLSNVPKVKALPSLLSNSGTVENFDMLEAPKPCNLTVRVGKEKGRKRRKRKGAVPELFEVSSSQSGNSTPSSPLSPVSATPPKQSWSLSPDVGQPHVVRNPFVRAANGHSEKDLPVEHASSKANKLRSEVSAKDCSKNWFSHTQEHPPAPRNTASKPVLLPSATFPCVGRTASSVLSSPFFTSTSKIAPHARAPGSKLCSQKSVKPEEKPGLKDEYVYDIWGDHFSGLHLESLSKDVSSSAKESDSRSFFVRGPQTLITTSQPRSVVLSSAGPRLQPAEKVTVTFYGAEQLGGPLCNPKMAAYCKI